jgi:ABC-type Fe3+ transport system permease subunit
MQAQSHLTLLTLLWIVHFILFAVATPIATVSVYSVSDEAWPWLENKTANHNSSLRASFFQSLQLSFDRHAKNSLS